jgi:hypothetical protein
LDDLRADFAKLTSAYERKVEVGKKYRPPDVLEWWAENGSECGSWAAAARLFTLVQPSSASCERGFSMLGAIINAMGNNMLEDMVDARLRSRFSIKNSDD